MTDPNIPPDRPTPLADLVVDVTKLQAPAVGLVTMLVTGGAIGLSTGSILKALLGLIPGVLALAGAIFGASHVATAGASLVTPVSDPQNNAGEPLVPAAPPPPPASPPVADVPADAVHKPLLEPLKMPWQQGGTT